jgi:phenylalanine-4-hydroxylase
MKPTAQIYSNYTETDFLVWKTLFNRQINILKPIVCTSYLSALETIKFSADKIPDFKEIKELLKPLTGWQIETVPNISPQKEFFQFLSQKKFTSTCWLRTMDQLDYLEEPDMFHDVFAHVPLLSNIHYVNFFKGISDIALKHIDCPKAIELLGRIYWFTIEFGLIKEDNAVKIYGAGIISSMGETLHCLSDKSVHLDFNVQEIFNTDFRTDILQEKYFVTESFEQLYNSLPEIERLLETMLEQVPDFIL